MSFRPMLAGAAGSLQDLTYPIYMSPKLDGIRAIVVNGVLVSRTLKPIPNLYTRQRFSQPQYEGLDGELTVGDPTSKDCFNITTSAVMREAGEPDVVFRVFDRVGQSGFEQRYIALSEEYFPKSIERLNQISVYNDTQATLIHESMLATGFEGSMIRSPNGPYKQGRSTTKEGYLLKLKPFVDDEAVITGFEEQMKNNNPAKTNLLGRTERSSTKANLVGANMLGALLVTNGAGQAFKVGTGFSEVERTQLWATRDTLVGRTIRYRYQAEGMKDLPRFPSYGGFRED